MIALFYVGVVSAVGLRGATGGPRPVPCGRESTCCLRPPSEIPAVGQKVSSSHSRTALGGSGYGQIFFGFVPILKVFGSALVYS